MRRLVIFLLLLAAMAGITVSALWRARPRAPQAAPVAAPVAAPITPPAQRASAPTMPPVQPMPVEAAPAHAAVGPDASTPYWLRGVAVNPEQRPVERFTVAVYREFELSIPAELRQPIERPDGVFEITRSGPEPVDLVITAPGYTQRVVRQMAPSSEREAPPWTILLVPEALIAGEVVTETGTPVAGAHVEWAIYTQEINVLDEGGHPVGPEEQAEVERQLAGVNPNPWQRTDAEGRFRLTGLAQGASNLIVTHPDYLPAAELIVLGPGERREGVRLVVTDQGGTVTVRVRDAAGSPVAGRAARLDGTPLAGVTSDEGIWRAEDVFPGMYQVIVGSPVEVPEPGVGVTAVHWKPVSVRAGEAVEVLFDLPPAITVRGEVRRGTVPVSGIAVEVGQSDSPLEEASQSFAIAQALTDDFGRFEVAGLAAGNYHLVVTQGNDTAEVAFSLADTDRERSFQVFLGQAELTGTVRDGRTGAPVPGAELSLVLMDAAEDEENDDVLHAVVERAITSDAQGGYQFTDLVPGRYVLDVAARRFGEVSLPVQAAGRLTQQEITLWPAGQLIVDVVTPDGLPAFGIQMTVALIEEPDNGVVAMTGPGGSVHFDDLAPGTYEVTVSASLGDPLAQRRTVEIASGGVARIEVMVAQGRLPSPPLGLPAS